MIGRPAIDRFCSNEDAECTWCLVPVHKTSDLDGLRRRPLNMSHLDSAAVQSFRSDNGES